MHEFRHAMTMMALGIINSWMTFWKIFRNSFKNSTTACRALDLETLTDAPYWDGVRTLAHASRLRSAGIFIQQKKRRSALNAPADRSAV